MLGVSNIIQSEHHLKFIEKSSWESISVANREEVYWMITTSLKQMMEIVKVDDGSSVRFLVLLCPEQHDQG